MKKGVAACHESSVAMTCRWGGYAPLYPPPWLNEELEKSECPPAVGKTFCCRP